MKYNKNEVTGKMRDRIILQNVTRVRSLTGFASEIWTDTTTIWAFAESKLPGSNETIIEGKNTANNICDFTIRYISSITEESRVVFKNKIYQVKNIKISHDRRFISFQGVYYDSYSTVIGLQFCSASLLAQSSLSAALMRVIKYQASLNAFGSVSADIALVQKVASSLNAFGTLTGDINFVQKVQASLLTSSSVTGNISIPKLVQASLTGAGTTTADLTVGSAIDADAQAFFDRVTAAGGTLNATERTAVNTLVVQMKADGIWTKMKAIYPMVGASAAACAQNLKSASFTGTFSSGWTFASTGVTPNGTSAYMDTNFNNQGNWTSTSNGSMGFVSRTNTSAPQCDMGAGTIINGANSSTIYSRISGDLFYSGLNCTTIVPGDSNTSSIGFFVTSRLSSTEYTRYKRGSSTINRTNTDLIGANPNTTIFLGAGNNSGSASYYSNKEFGFCFIGDGLTQTQVDNYWTALQTFNTTLSR